MEPIDPGKIDAFSVSMGLRGNVVIVRLSGELDMATAPQLREQLAKAIALLSPPLLIVDTENLEFCDSSGLSVLMRALSEVEYAAGQMVLSGVRDRFARMLKITGLKRALRIYANADIAAAELGETGH